MEVPRNTKGTQMEKDEENDVVETNEVQATSLSPRRKALQHQDELKNLHSAEKKRELVEKYAYRKTCKSEGCFKTVRKNDSTQLPIAEQGFCSKHWHAYKDILHRRESIERDAPINNAIIAQLEESTRQRNMLMERRAVTSAVQNAMMLLHKQNESLEKQTRDAEKERDALLALLMNSAPRLMITSSSSNASHINSLILPKPSTPLKAPEEEEPEEEEEYYIDDPHLDLKFEELTLKSDYEAKMAELKERAKKLRPKHPIRK